MKIFYRIWYGFHDRFLQKAKLRFITRFYNGNKGKYCWTDCVSWAYSPSSFNPYKISDSKGCERESKCVNNCYCGCWINGKCFELLSEDEQQQAWKEFHSQVLTKTPPF